MYHTLFILKTVFGNINFIEKVDHIHASTAHVNYPLVFIYWENDMSCTNLRNKLTDVEQVEVVKTQIFLEIQVWESLHQQL